MKPSVATQWGFLLAPPFCAGAACGQHARCRVKRQSQKSPLGGGLWSGGAALNSLAY